MVRRLALIALLSAAALAGAAEPQFWRIEGARDFLDGETDGLSVDSEGHVRLAPTFRLLYDPEAPSVWAMVRAKDGTLYAGSGNDGRVFKVQGGKGALFYDAPELEVHALALGPDGRLFVGSSPEGKVYAVDATGKATAFFDPEEKYVWALAFDAKGNLLVATGSEGKVYRVDPQGKAETILESAETHILSLAQDGKGNVFAGSAPSGILYRIEPNKKVFVLLDSAFREVKAIDVRKEDQSLYLAAVDGKTKDDTSPAAVQSPAAAAPGGAPVAEVTVTESFAMPASAGAGHASEAPGGPPKASVLRLLPSGEIETLWSSPDETIHALAATPGGVLVATGNKGKVYRVQDDRTWSMVLGFPADQITALLRGEAGAFYLAASNPGRLYTLESGTSPRGTFVSKVKDTETASSFGRVTWSTGPDAGEVQIQTRSGNTSSPDATWSDWSAPYLRREGTPVTSERARFLQVKATLVAKGTGSPVLDSVTTAYLQRNLRPEVQSITVHPPGEAYQKPLSVGNEVEILGLDPASSPDPVAPAPGTPAAISVSRKIYQRGIQTFSWKAEDANADRLSYDVFYRPASDSRFRPLRRGLTEPVLAWDTTTVPNGRYVVRIAAGDSPSNPPALALVGVKESLPFDVDNTPPTVTASVPHRGTGIIRATARDDSSLIRRAESSMDGAPWEDLHPVDGINDSLEETYELTVPAGGKGGPHVVVIRVFDLLGNASTARVDTP
jgi:hypothetical protein